MTHTLISRTLHALGLLSLVAGIGLTTSQAALYAEVTGVGAVISTELRHAASPETVPLLVPAVDNLQDNTLKAAQAAANLALGVLLIVLGFFVHGFISMRYERPVHITVKPKKRRATWFWMEMRV